MRHLQIIALYIFFFSINFEVWDPFQTEGHFSISKLTGYIYLIVMLPLVIRFNTSNEIKHVLKPILLFFGLLTLVSIFHINLSYHDFFDFTIFQNIILFWLLVNHECFERKLLEKGMLSFAFGSITLAMLYNMGIGIEYSFDRVSIFGDNQNNIGIRMSISMLIIILTVLQNRLQLGKMRFLLLLPIPLMLKLMAETGSRVSVLSFLAAFLLGGVLYKTNKIWGKILVFSIGALLFIYVWKFLTETEIVKFRLLESILERDLAGREIIWEKLILLIKRNLIFGVGKTGYEYYTLSIFGRETSPHNVFLEVLCYTGIIGLLLYIIFLYRIFLNGFQKYKLNGVLLPIILLIPVFGLLVSGQTLYQKIGWAIFAYVSNNSLLNLNQT